MRSTASSGPALPIYGLWPFTLSRTKTKKRGTGYFFKVRRSHLNYYILAFKITLHVENHGEVKRIC